MNGLILDRRHWIEMRDHVSRQAPEEACGLLAGSTERSTAVLPVENELHSPVLFRMEPHQQVAALNTLDERGWDLLAIYHSHPRGPDHPSATDVAEAYDPEVIHLIWFPQDEDWSCRAFRILEDRIAEVPLTLIE